MNDYKVMLDFISKRLLKDDNWYVGDTKHMEDWDKPFINGERVYYYIGIYPFGLDDTKKEYCRIEYSFNKKKKLIDVSII